MEKYFSYHPDAGFYTYPTAELAREDADRGTGMNEEIGHDCDRREWENVRDVVCESEGK